MVIKIAATMAMASSRRAIAYQPPAELLANL
jgi:hypothetical protein